MNVVRLVQVRRLYNSPYAPTEINRANQRKWVRAVRQLGASWLLASPMPRGETCTH